MKKWVSAEALEAAEAREREAVMQSLAHLGQAQDAYEAQKKAEAEAAALREAIRALTPAPMTVSEAARIVWDDCLQKASPEAARQRKKAIKAIMRLKIPSIPMAQRWAIVNVALRALAGQGGE